MHVQRSPHDGSSLADRVRAERTVPPGGRSRTPCPVRLVPRARPDRAPAERRRRAAARLPGRGRAGRALRRRRARAAPGRRLGPRRAARPARRRPRLHHRRPPGAGAGAPGRLGRGDLGRPASPSARSAPQRRGFRIEITTYRAEAYDRGSPQPGGQLRRLAGRRPGPARLHRQRDGRRAAGLGPPTPSSTRTAGWTTSPPSGCARRAGRRTPSATTRCGCCGPPASPPSSASPSRPRSSRRWRRWPTGSRSSASSGSATS